MLAFKQRKEEEEEEEEEEEDDDEDWVLFLFRQKSLFCLDQMQVLSRTCRWGKKLNHKQKKKKKLMKMMMNQSNGLLKEF